MQRPFWTKKKIAAVVLLGVAYFGLWEVTARLGAPIIREAAVADHSISTFTGRALIASCEASAVAPFIVKAQCKRAQLSSGLVMTVDYVLWPGKWRRRIWRSPAVFIP
jgi:hypothetical protein